MRNCWSFRRLSISFVAASLLGLSSNTGHAEPILVDGVKYNNREEAVAAFKRLADYKLQQVIPENYTAAGLRAIGGKFLVVTPSVQNATRDFVWVTGGIFKPSREAQEVVGQGEVIKIEHQFRMLAKGNLISSVRFVSETVQGVADEREADYLITLRTHSDGLRTPKAVAARTTEYILTNLKTGTQTVVLTAMGSPGVIDPMYFAKQLCDAVARVNSP